LRYRWDPDDSLSTASFPAHWVRRGLDWYYDGLAWNQAQGEHVVVMHLDQRSLADRMVEAADEWYAFFTEQATWALPQKVYIRFYGVGGATDDAAISLAGSRNLLHALQDAPSGYQASSGWPVDDGIVLSDNANLQTTLTEFALAQAGWPSPTTSWMAQGLTDHLTMTDTAAAEQLKSEYLSTLLQADDEGRLWAAEAMPTRWEVQPGDRNTWDAQAWAMTDYLLQGSGWTGMQRPVSAISDAWRIALLDPWLDVAQGIEKTLEQRAEAILSQDREAFLSTVDAHNSVLYVEETHWFDDLAPYPADRFAYESELLELNGEEAIVNLQVRYRVPSVEWAPLTPSYQARFVQRDGQWLYSGLDFSEQRSEHFVLKYESADYAPYAPRLLAEAERAYVQVTSDLEAHPKTPIEIKLYHHTDVFRFSIYMSMPQITGWNEPGEAIKLNVAGREAFLEQGAPRVIAHELTHAVLFAMGVQHGALHEGICEDEAIRFDPVTGNTKLRQYRREVYDLVRSQRPITVHDLADWREVSSDDLHLFYSVGWDFVTYFRQRFGRQRLLAWLKLLGSGLTFEEAFAQAAGLPFATVDAEWRESVLRGHIPAEYIETALAFDPEQALGHVVRLAAPEWAGREAGTAGNEAAAQYVAERFAAYGLEPAGDAGSYLQHFPVSRVALSDTPELVIASDDGQELRLRYRSDFHELLGASAGSGQVDRTIVYVRDPLNAEVHLGGRVLLTHLGADPWQQAEAAIRVGAGGVLLMTTKWEKDMAVKAGVVQSLNTESLPVLELTKQASEALFGLLGYRTHQIDDLPAILPLPLAAKMKVQAVASPDAQAANVLGILPGSDPELSSQVLILSAHLDHVGSLPDGTVFPGANNDASGVAVMLEIARLWHEAGYQPRRSVLFAAWNAAEMGSLGSSYYVAHPAYPLRDTVDLIQLDEVGAAKGYYILVPGDDTQEALILAHLDNAARQVEGRLTFERYRASSDQDPFHRRGVPALVLTWDEPLNRYVPDDTPDTLDLQKLQAMGRVVALTMMTMADD
jgi:hypothetical protein